MIKNYVDNIFDNIDSQDERRCAFIHTYSVAQCSSLLALRRGLDPELGYICGLLHDVYSYKTGYHVYHSINGAEMLRVLFKNELKDIFTEEEQMIIRSAVFHHSDKDHIHDSYDELLKDSDALEHWLSDVSKDDFIIKRLLGIQKELGLPVSTVSDKEKNEKTNRFSRNRMSDIAEKLGQKHIQGIESDAEYRNIIRYYPEPSAFDELHHAWCAAFVYHCAVMAGLEIPIRYEPLANTRFACVEAWLKWGEQNHICFWEKDGFTPSKGDIVIYNNIISPENKPANTPWYDHIGIVIEHRNGILTVVEGNYNNSNHSKIVTRKRDEKIGCYIRIPDNYEYDGRKYDYKTQVIRQDRI
jgi:HD superfamily phosphodiesterase